MFLDQITSDRLRIEAPAKINLFLEVLNRRDDGYHNINSLFQAISLSDHLDFQRITRPGIRIAATQTDGLPLDDSNLIARAYSLMSDLFGLVSGMTVRLTKRIPIAAGLGGGSADGAATILACNRLFGLGLDRAEMASIGLRIGSDVPFFFSSGQVLVTGRGEQMRQTRLPVDYWLVLVTPKLAISTAESYARLNLDLTDSKSPLSLHGCQTVDELIAAIRQRGNDLESVRLLPRGELLRIKKRLSGSGAALSRMSGSGPTVFGIYSEPPGEEQVNYMHREGWQISTARPIFLDRER